MDQHITLRKIVDNLPVMLLHLIRMELVPFRPRRERLTGASVIDNIPLFYLMVFKLKMPFVLDGNSYYFSKRYWLIVRDRFWSDDDGNWYYSDKEGKLLTGEQTIDGSTYFFTQTVFRPRVEIVTIGIEPHYF